MTDETLIQAGAGDDRLIGVGMGGSCPSCRSPIDLGQEFCLECGAPIRFSTRQRKGRGSGSGGSAAAGDTPTAPRNFPWLPFCIVLALIIGGIAFAVIGTGGSPSASKAPKTKTETALPQITNSTPTDTTPSDATGAGAACPTDGSTTTPTDPNAAAGSGTGEQIPQVTPSPGQENNPAGDAFPSTTPSAGATDAVPSTTPDASSGATGSNCTPGSSGALPGATSTLPGASDPASTIASTPTTASTPASTTASTVPTTATTTPTSSTTPASTTTSWPANTDGWTVVVFAYTDQNRANQRAADLQQDNFPSGVLYSSDYGSLCPGFYVVFSGVYTTEAQAKNQKVRLQGKYQGMYVKKIAKNGTAHCAN